MKLLLLGSGGREHALAWKIAQSPKIEKLYIAPGNAGTSEVGENVILNLNDFAEIGDFVKSKAIDMLVVGPEAPLVKGIVDYFRQDEDLKKVKVIGPSQAGAQLEGSKDFAKRFMRRHNIPTAASTAQAWTKALHSSKRCNRLTCSKPTGWPEEKAYLSYPTLKRQKRNSATCSTECSATPRRVW